MFAKSHRLSRSYEIEQLVRFGRRFTTAHVVIYWDMPGEKSGKSYNNGHSQPPRVTVVVGKKTAKGAVTRNRLKRRVRAALKSLRLPAGCRVVAFPKIAALTIPFTVIVEEVERWQDKI